MNQSTRAADWFRRCEMDGRATIVYQSEPDDAGRAEPRLWLCVLGNELVAVDDVGPDSDVGDDPGFVRAVLPGETVGDVYRSWRNYRKTRERRGRGRGMAA